MAPTPPEQRLPEQGDADARARFRDAQSRFGRDAEEPAAAAARFESIAREYPDDPIAPYARLYAGIAALDAEDYAQAEASFLEVTGDPATRSELVQRARLFLGITYNYLGRHEQALEYLLTSEEAINDERERVEWLAAMAESHARGPAPLAAARFYNEWHRLGAAEERGYIRDRLEALARDASVIEARAAYDELVADTGPEGPAAAILGTRVAADYAAEGEADRARAIRAAIAPARRELGLAPGPGEARRGSVRRWGTVLPLSGRRARAGDLALKGLALATGTFREIAGVGGFEVSVHDTTSLSAGARAAVDALEREGAIAVVGPIDGDSVDAAASRAHALGMPLISLNPRSGRRFGPSLPQGSPYVFHILQSAEDRAEVLARHALAQGVRRFAILGPDSGYGRAVTSAFVDEVERGGGEIVTRASYASKETSFGPAVESLKGSFEAVFVPDQAARLTLIAPALAVADLYALPRSAAKPKVGRKILLLSTAEFLTPRYLRSAGRYSEGAILAPGFYPDREDPVIGDFVARYERAYGDSPTPLDAYAYDAARVISEAVRAGAESRAELGERMAGAETEGLTGTIRFDSARRRRDDGLLFQVVRDRDALEIRAMRD